MPPRADATAVDACCHTCYTGIWRDAVRAAQYHMRNRVQIANSLGFPQLAIPSLSSNLTGGRARLPSTDTAYSSAHVERSSENQAEAAAANSTVTSVHPQQQPSVAPENAVGEVTGPLAHLLALGLPFTELDYADDGSRKAVNVCLVEALQHQGRGCAGETGTDCPKTSRNAAGQTRPCARCRTYNAIRCAPALTARLFLRAFRNALVDQTGMRGTLGAALPAALLASLSRKRRESDTVHEGEGEMSVRAGASLHAREPVLASAVKNELEDDSVFGPQLPSAHLSAPTNSTHEGPSSSPTSPTGLQQSQPRTKLHRAPAHREAGVNGGGGGYNAASADMLPKGHRDTTLRSQPSGWPGSHDTPPQINIIEAPGDAGPAFFAPIHSFPVSARTPTHTHTHTHTQTHTQTGTGTSLAGCSGRADAEGGACRRGQAGPGITLQCCNACSAKRLLLCIQPGYQGITARHAVVLSAQSNLTLQRR
eukprot:m.196254 g.196254  ORF g.196254 m.196254 type:complete len:480 (-) comp15462_c3_seq9:1425-2864(-)